MSSEENSGASQNTGTVPGLQEEKLASAPGVKTMTELKEEYLDSSENTATALEVQDETSGSTTSVQEESPIPPPDPGAVPALQIELPNITAEAPESTEIDTLLAGMGALAEVPQGKVVKGKVLRVTEAEVRVSVGVNLEGAVAVSEFLTSDGQLTVAPGDEVGVWVERYNEKQGTVTLSRQKAARLEIWEAIESAFRDQKPIRGRVVDRIKGGLTVDIGVHAFMPSSQADLRPLRNPDSLMGQEITCKVIKLIRKRSNVVVSRKLALEEEAARNKAALLERLKEGVELVGRVKNLTDYGAFLDLGGMDGLLHVTDMAWSRVARPSDVVKVGQEVKVKVLKFDPEKGRISLGIKQLLPDPWERVAAVYHVGDRIKGRVANVTDYGAFVELEPGIEGLVHVSEMSWSKRPKHPSKIVKPGDRAEVAVLDVNPAQRRISLSLKQTLTDPWETLAEKYPVGSQVDATVTNLTEFGAFAEIDPDVEGLIHNADLSWTKKVKHPSEVLKKGQKIKAEVLSLDATHRRLSLGLKQLRPDPWQAFASRVGIGDKVKAKVARMAPFGAFVEIEEGIEGLCHTSEFGDTHGSAGKGKLDVGSELEFRVIRLDPIERKISLSLKPAVGPPPTPSKRETQTESASSGSAASVAPQEPKKKAAPATAMAEALSAAGITSALAPRPQAPTQASPAKVEPKPEPIPAAPLSSAPSATAEQKPGPAVTEIELPAPSVVAEQKPSLASEQAAPPALTAEAERAPSETVEKPAPPSSAVKITQEPVVMVEASSLTEPTGENAEKAVAVGEDPRH